VRRCDVRIGDQILFGKYSGTEVKADREEFVVMREEDVMAVYRVEVTHPKDTAMAQKEVRFSDDAPTHIRGRQRFLLAKLRRL